MYPEFFEIPFTDLTIKSYGLMMVVGFLAAIYLIRRLSRDITPDPQLITNAALYSLIAGVVGARLFYVVHYFDQFQHNLLSIFAIWSGGLELLGGVILAIAVIFLYLRYHKLPIRKYLDILAIGLFLALGFGRVGCILNGCCFGKPADLPWAIRFPYGSFAYRSQVYPDIDRDRDLPRIELDADFFGYNENGVHIQDLKPYELLTQQQKQQVAKNGPYRCLAVHPTQLYSSAGGFFSCLMLYLFWRMAKKSDKPFARPGCTFALMFIVYGPIRFFIEFLRDDNPFGFDGLTISQNISIAMVAFGLVLMAVFAKIKPAD